MVERRNIVIVGSPNSGSGEVFDAILRHTPQPPLVIHYTEGMFLEEHKPPYDAKNREKLFGKRSE